MIEPSSLEALEYLSHFNLEKHLRSKKQEKGALIGHGRTAERGNCT
jgi:hypothetical protein